MKCLYCGSEIPDRSTFCLDCGSPVVGEGPEHADYATALRHKRAFRQRVAITTGIAAGAAAVAIVGAIFAVRFACKGKEQARLAVAGAARRVLDIVDPQ